MLSILFYNGKFLFGFYWFEDVETNWSNQEFFTRSDNTEHINYFGSHNVPTSKCYAYTLTYQCFFAMQMFNLFNCMLTWETNSKGLHEYDCQEITPFQKMFGILKRGFHISCLNSNSSNQHSDHFIKNSHKHNEPFSTSINESVYENNLSQVVSQEI